MYINNKYLPEDARQFTNIYYVKVLNLTWTVYRVRLLTILLSSLTYILGFFYRDMNKDGFMDEHEVKEWIAPPEFDHAEAEARLTYFVIMLKLTLRSKVSKIYYMKIV